MKSKLMVIAAIIFAACTKTSDVQRVNSTSMDESKRDCEVVSYIGEVGSYPFTKVTTYDTCPQSKNMAYNGVRNSVRYVNPATAKKNELVRADIYKDFQMVYYNLKDKIIGLNTLNGSTEYRLISRAKGLYVYELKNNKNYVDRDGNTSKVYGTQILRELGDGMSQKTGTTHGIDVTKGIQYKWISIITQPIIRDITWPYPLQGTIRTEITSNGTTDIQTLDYGNGQKDNKATINGVEVVLPVEFYGE